MRKLIISEKYNTAQRISIIISNGNSRRGYLYKTPVFTFNDGTDDITIVGLRGHILELDYPEEYNSWEKVDLSKLVWVEPVKKKSAASIAGAIENLALETDEIIIATDYDREGELIGVEAIDIMAKVKKNLKIKRAKFSALTKSEINDAFTNLVEVDYNLAKAAEARQIIDLAWGAVITRFLSLSTGQVGRDFLSAGRIQSPTLALIVDREREIEGFKPEPYWKIIADVQKDDAHFDANHAHGIFSAAEKKNAEQILNRIKGCKTGTVKKVTHEKKNERPPSPFNTTTFLAEATKLGLSAQSAMKIAEDLYTKGYISYPRTDNTVYPPSLNIRSILNNLKKSQFSVEAGEILAQKSIYPTRGSIHATDHPPIHPVEGATKGELKGEHWTIYELVVRRFLATLAPDAVAGLSRIDIDIGKEPFFAEGYVIIEPGWRKYYIYWKVNEIELPKLKEMDIVTVLKLQMAEFHTKPPARYTQGSLIQKMEQLGLGTKSTRHEIIQKLYDRKYVVGKAIAPTLPGRAVTVALEDYAKEITESKMTALLEDEMNSIANGQKLLDEVVKDSQQILAGIIKELEDNKEKIGKEINDALKQHNFMGNCSCGGNLIIRKNKTGGRFMGCTNYPACSTLYPLPTTGMITSTDEICTHCDLPIIQVIHKDRGAEKICLNPKCPETFKTRFVGKCNKCGGDLKIIHSAKGKRFVGCSNYPKCTNTFPLPQIGRVVITSDICPACKSPMVKVYTKGKKIWNLCINMQCSTKKKADEKIVTDTKPNRK